MNKTPPESGHDPSHGSTHGDIESPGHPLNAADLGHVHIGIFDVDGAFRHKRVGAQKARKLARNGYSFCEVLYQWDTAEEPYITGPFLDRPAELDPESFRPWPFADDDLFCIADFSLPYGERSARNQLRAQVDKAARLGFSVHSAFEFEFMVLDETPASLRDKDYTQLNFLARGNRTYSLQTAAVYDDLIAGLEDVMNRAGVGLDSVHSELGPGCFEAPLTHAPGIRGADDAALFKNFAKAWFQRHDLMATFMSTLGEDLPNQSGHLHISLRDLESGEPALSDPNDPDGISATARHFIGGLLELMPSWLVLTNPTINAYKRIGHGGWAPAQATWGIQNRTTAVRVINDSPGALRIEFRAPGADTNPHAALAAVLAAGLWGVEHRCEPPPPREDDCEAPPRDAPGRFPRSLAEAADWFEASEAARSVFGDTFVDQVVGSRRIEDAAWRRHVSPWEIARYLEVV
jgi:glutamine synthetase